MPCRVVDAAKGQVPPHTDMEGGKGGFVLNITIPHTAGELVQADPQLPGHVNAGVAKGIHVTLQLRAGLPVDLHQPALLEGKRDGGGGAAQIAQRAVHNSPPAGLGLLNANIDLKAGGANLAGPVGQAVKQARLPAPLAKGQVCPQGSGDVDAPGLPQGLQHPVPRAPGLIRVHRHEVKRQRRLAVIAGEGEGEETSPLGQNLLGDAVGHKGEAGRPNDDIILQDKILHGMEDGAGVGVALLNRQQRHHCAAAVSRRTQGQALFHMAFI